MEIEFVLHWTVDKWSMDDSGRNIYTPEPHEFFNDDLLYLISMKNKLYHQGEIEAMSQGRVYTKNFRITARTKGQT